MPDEHRTIDACAALRENCRDAIYRKMDGQHNETMDALSLIKSRLAFQDGEQAATRRDLITEIKAQDDARVDAREAVEVARAAVTAANLPRSWWDDVKKQVVANVLSVISGIIVLLVTHNLWKVGG